MSSIAGPDRLQRHTEKLRSIAHPLRLAIIALLQQHSRMSVSEIHTQLDIKQATASHHLRLLRQVDVVQVNREGQYAYYSLVDDVYPQIIHLLNVAE